MPRATNLSGGNAKRDEAVLRRLRRICLGFPETLETTTFGHPTFQRKSKTFAVLDSYRGERCICFKTIPPVRRSLSRTRAFFPAPYGAWHGWICARAAGRLGWRRLEKLLAMSHDLVGRKPSRKSRS
jgi:predicted DNA-binding protein (MmcQ/YjbR family)